MITAFLFYNKKRNNKVGESVLSILDFYYNFINSLEVSTVACPTCGHHEMIRWGFYFRRISISGDIYTLKVQRLYCKNCHHSHAVFIADIIPYQMINIRSAISVMCGKEYWEQVLMDNPQMVQSDLYRLKKKYHQFQERIQVIHKTFMDGIESILPRFFEEYHIQLFQCRWRCRTYSKDDYQFRRHENELFLNTNIA